MALPANTSTVVVLGTFLTPEGNPSTGSVTFTASSWLTNTGANVSIPNSSVSKSLGTAGNFTVTLPITDDPDITPLEFIYLVSEVVDGVSRSYNISIPGTVAAGGTVYLADLVPVAPAGPEYYSLASSLSIGTVSTLPAGSAATADITGLAPNQVLDLGIPTGPAGSAASVTVGSVTGTAYNGGSSISVTNSGSSSAAVLDFVLEAGPTGATGPTGPQGPAATVEVGSVTSGTAGGTPTVTNSGTSGSAVLDFVLIPGNTGPQGPTGATGAVGPQGSAATVQVGSVTTGTAGSTASVTNSGTSGSAVLDFVIPRGDKGDTGNTGPQGSAASITVGTVTAVAFGGTASVTNSGTSGSAVLDFVLVTGPQGDLAGLSADAPLAYANNTFSLDYGAGLGTATGGTLVADLSSATPAALGTAAAGTATQIARADHVHALPTTADIGAVGTAVAITAGTGLAGGGDLSASRTIDVVLSTATPAGLGAAAVGTSNNPARGDHVHAMPSAADVGAVGTATAITAGNGLTGGGDLTTSRTLNVDYSSSAAAALGTAAAGTATTASRSDHVHGMPSAADVGAVANSIVTAKGDLVVATGNAALDNLAVGTDGHILTADSAQTLGVKWAAAPVSLPTQTSNGGKLLTTDGSSASWTNLLSTLIHLAPMERFNVVASAATGTINVDVKTAAVWFYTTNASADHTINFRGDSSTTLSSLLAVEDAYTVGWMINNGTTAYYPTTVQVDGTAVTPKWLNDAPPPAASVANQTAGVDSFLFTIIKTASTPTYTVLGSWAQYK